MQGASEQGTGTDRYKRTLACVTVGDIEVEAQVIATGHAWHYSRYATRRRWKPQNAMLGPLGVGWGGCGARAAVGVAERREGTVGWRHPYGGQ